MLDQLTEQLRGGISLSNEQVRLAIDFLAGETVAPEPKADFLSALAAKGETVEEIAAFAMELRNKSVPVPIDASVRAAGLLDVVGTGGDQLGTFNISTCSAIIAAAAGIPVAKHGNRAITSLSGSADVLEALGIRIDLTPGQAAAFLRDHQFVFLFAPRFHPAFKHIAPARKLCAARSQRTIFNFLGPLLNPARPFAQLVGVAAPAYCEPFARVLQALGIQRGLVVCGQAGASHMDELSTLGENTIAEFYQSRGLAVSTGLMPGLPFQKATLEDLKGADRQANALLVRGVLSGADRGPKRDAVLLNAGAALWAAGKTSSITEGWDQAAQLIDGGAASAKLEELVQASQALSD